MYTLHTPPLEELQNLRINPGIRNNVKVPTYKKKLLSVKLSTSYQSTVTTYKTTEVQQHIPIRLAREVKAEERASYDRRTRILNYNNQDQNRQKSCIHPTKNNVITKLHDVYVSQIQSKLIQDVQVYS